ncbi:hypothetical protein KSB_11460 [Ktedonobacter robiniae]|uniref:Uncharacterized protein n=1 Tax=Ktedonobacter robiniae TaxID=2778365 RepID=A0ABQ3UIW3_9CHLR|nr:hypothetical protein KSB_11460 [Ktedonobacter robiniae]
MSVKTVLILLNTLAVSEKIFQTDVQLKFDIVIQRHKIVSAIPEYSIANVKNINKPTGTYVWLHRIFQICSFDSKI